MILHSSVYAFECKLGVSAARSLFCPSAPMHFEIFTFVNDFVSPSIHYSINDVTEVSAIGCPLPSFVVMSSDLDEHSEGVLLPPETSRLCMVI